MTKRFLVLAILLAIFSATNFTPVTFASELEDQQLHAEIEATYLHAGSYFPVQAYAFAMPYQVSVQVVNFYARPIVCEGWVQGMTNYGQTAWSFFTMAPIWPGMVGYAYVYAFPPSTFVGAWANAYCRIF